MQKIEVRLDLIITKAVLRQLEYFSLRAVVVDEPLIYQELGPPPVSVWNKNIIISGIFSCCYLPGML